ncbi:hypothetical protein EV702DRAFT_1131260 [Suillus placidus]|uniref:Uncharacterized protein n=1 Tax=Suillus placidus TaxID=48579 RepID=A0A9P7D063_9AGAM|nr:hypothetical protein EV702DRAFT_1131260 [Suillus placidus]
MRSSSHTHDIDHADAAVDKATNGESTTLIHLKKDLTPVFTMPSERVSRLRLELVAPTQHASNSEAEEDGFSSPLSSLSSLSDTKDYEYISSLISVSSHSVEPSRGRTEARRSDGDKPARTRIKLPLPQRAEIAKNTVAQDEGIAKDNSHWRESGAEPAQVDEDWKMGSPSPIELTYAPAHFHRLYKDEDIVMASPTEPTHSPVPQQVEDSSLWGSSSWDTDPSRSPSPKQVQDCSPWESSWDSDPPRSTTPKQVQDCSTWESSWDTDPPRSPSPKQFTQDSATWGSSPL